MDVQFTQLLKFQRDVLLQIRWLLDDDVEKELIRALIDILHNIPVSEETFKFYDLERLREQCVAFHETWEDYMPNYLNLLSLLAKYEV